MIQIPADRLFDAFRKHSLRFPADLSFDLIRSDRVASVMSFTVFYISNEIFAYILLARVIIRQDLL